MEVLLGIDSMQHTIYVRLFVLYRVAFCNNSIEIATPSFTEGIL